MWHDLDSDRWPSDARLIDKPIVQRLLLGPKPGDVAPGQVSEEYATEDGDKIPLVCDADSSQYSAIFDALGSKESLVVEGPPGTGKSQTITNLIAAAIGQGKTVLFVAEKMEALRVVYERLENMGLDDFCLQLHGLKTKKIELLESIKARTEIDTPPPRNSVLTKQELSSARTRLVNVSKALAKVYGPEKVALHDIFWRIERLRSELPDELEPVESEGITELDYEHFSHARNLLNDLAKEWSEIREDARHAWQGFLPRVQTTGSSERVLSALQRIAEAIDSARQSFAAISIDSSSFSSTLDVNRIRELGQMDPETSFPALPTGIPVDLAYNIVHGGDIDAFHSLADSVSSYLNDIADANRVLDYEDERTHAFAEQLDKRCSLLVNGFLPRDVLIGDLSERQEESRNVLKSLDDLAADTEPLLLLLGVSPRTLDDYERLAGRAKQYIDGPQTLSLYASPMHAQSATVAHLDSAREECKHLLKTLDDRLGAFRLIATSKTVTLREAYEYLEIKKDSWFPFIDRQYRESQRVVCSVLKDPKTYSLDRQFLDGVAELVDFCLARDQFSNSTSGEFLGPLFRGIDSDWSLLEDTVSFSQVLRRDFGLGTAKRVLDDWAAHVEVISECRRNIDRTLALTKVYAARHNLPKNLWKRPVRSVASTLRPWVSHLEDAVRHISLDLCSSDASLDDALRAVDSCRSAKERESLLESNPRFERLLGPMWQGARTDIDGLRALKSWFNDRLRFPCVNVELLQFLLPTPDVLRRDLAYEILEIARAFCETLSANLDELMIIGDIDVASWTGGHRSSLSDLHEKMQACVATIDYLPLLFRWSRAHSECVEMGLGAYSLLVSSDELKGTEAGQALEYSLYALIAKYAVENEPLLRDFSRSRHESCQNRFANLDRLVLEENAQDIGARLCRSPVPAGVGYGPVRNYSEKRLLDHEAGKQKRHIPIRQLVLRASAALKALKPCFLMSPLSVAQYLPPGTVKFDFVIMDEASQIRPEDALGAMARADKAIIVGDPKQLPPTSFFDSATVADDSAEEMIADDAESILDVCLKQFPFRRLRWHYRSQHEDLIRFSNEKFYNGDLIVFPSARGTSRDFGVHYTKVSEPSYKHGRNRNEAELIVENIVKHYRQFSDKSLGVAAFNRRQAEEIQALLDNQRINDPLLDELIASRTENEPLFIKNLENVQGDERDVIFISTTYGPEHQGAKTFQRFGPINSDLGWRRLNVIATRARQRVEVFSSMRSSDILVGDTARKGVRALRDYLEYAETGRIAEEISVGGEPETDFEETVGKLVCDLGYEVAYQVGVAGFFIDIGVRHPDRSGEYLMGVECDGATYHSGRSIRDRDRLRQTILESKGWSIHRIWSTNWFHARVAEVDRLADALAQQLANDRAAHARPVEQADELIVAEAAAAYSTEVPEREADDQGLREALDRFWKTNIAPTSPDRSRSILSEPIVDRIVAAMPETREEWIESVPLAERERVEARQGVFVEDILEIVWDHVQALQSRRRDDPDDAKAESKTDGRIMSTPKEKEIGNGLAWSGQGVRLPHGTKLRMKYGAREYNGVIDNGDWLFNGQRCNSPSGACKVVARTIGGKVPSLNGWMLWWIMRPSDRTWVAISQLRRAAVRRS